MDDAGWAGRTMVFLRVVAQLVAVNLLIVLGTALGGVLLGLMPAVAAGAELLARLARGDASDRLWREFWSGYRASWRRLNLLGLPFWIIGGAVALDLAVLRAGESVAGPTAAGSALTAVVVVLGLGAVLALAYLFPVARRYDETALRTWRFILMASVTAPVTGLAVVVPVVSWIVLMMMWPVLAPLAAVSLPLLVTGWVVDQRLGAIDSRAGSSAAEPDGSVTVDSRTTIR